jgi:hypothetical protein
MPAERQARTTLLRLRLPEGYQITDVDGGRLIARETIDLTGATGRVHIRARVRKS